MSVSRSDARGGADGVVVRHKSPDRLVHWLSAVCMFVLLGTGFLPILGIKFEWVTIHWVTGLVLLALLVLHIIRTIARGTFMSMWIGLDDIRIALGPLTKNPEKPGKYSPAQKMMHHGVTTLVLLTLATGLVMMVKVDTPLWERNPYLLEGATWGIIYVVHGLSALALITTVMLHIYFSLRPEKLMYTRSMIKGWLTREEYLDNHDPAKWEIKNGQG